MPTTLRRALALTLLTLLVVACADPETTDAPDEEDDPEVEATPQPDDDPGEDEGTLEGTLGGDPLLEGGCVWLDTDEGRYEVAWPEGYDASADPIELRDPDGEVLAREGDGLRVTGEVNREAFTICQVGPLWEADEVEAR